MWVPEGRADQQGKATSHTTALSGRPVEHVVSAGCFDGRCTVGTWLRNAITYHSNENSMRKGSSVELRESKLEAAQILQKAK